MKREREIKEKELTLPTGLALVSRSFLSLAISFSLTTHSRFTYRFLSLEERKVNEKRAR